MSIAGVKGPQVSEQSADIERVLAPNFTLQRPLRSRFQARSHMRACSKNARFVNTMECLRFAPENCDL